MAENKNVNKGQQVNDQKSHIKPGDIKGKIEVTDNRERRDGPGGN